MGVAGKKDAEGKFPDGVNPAASSHLVETENEVERG
jgi:hypothetical protein